jgi:hypothetical protein
MTIDTALLERIGIRVSPDEIERQVEAALRSVLPHAVVSQPADELSAAEAEALTRGGLDLSPQGSRASDTTADNALARSAAEYAALVASSVTVAEAARRLDVDGSRIRQRLAARTLYGIRQGAGWRIPSFQFAGNALVPNIERVLPCLSEDLSPLTVLHWFTLPNTDLVRGPDETPTSPLGWLLAGERPEAVADLARDLDAGI